MVLSSSKGETNKEKLPSYWELSPFSKAAEKLLKLNCIVQDSAVFQPTESKLGAWEKYGMTWCSVRGKKPMLGIVIAGWGRETNLLLCTMLCPAWMLSLDMISVYRGAIWGAWVSVFFSVHSFTQQSVKMISVLSRLPWSCLGNCRVGG